MIHFDIIVIAFNLAGIKYREWLEYRQTMHAINTWLVVKGGVSL